MHLTVLGILLVIANTAESDNSPGISYERDGKICQETEETVEETVEEAGFDKEIHCNVELKEVCDDDDDDLCTTVFKKTCETTYRPQMTRMKVRVCPNGEEDAETEKANNSVVMDVRPSPPSSSAANKCDEEGKRIVCMTKHETECKTEYNKQDMVEDHPRCRVQMVEKCEKEKCKMIPAMRCRIEMMTVTKTKPETKCSRVPRQFCRKEDCQIGGTASEQCYFRTQIVNEIVPEEQCYIQPHRICRQKQEDKQQLQQMVRKRSSDIDQQQTDNNNKEAPLRIDGHNCRMEPVQKCKMTLVKSRPIMKKIRKTICTDQQQTLSDSLLITKLTHNIDAGIAQQP